MVQEQKSLRPAQGRYLFLLWKRLRTRFVGEFVATSSQSPPQQEYPPGILSSMVAEFCER